MLRPILAFTALFTPQPAAQAHVRPNDLATALSNVGHADRQTAAEACAAVLSHGDTAIPLLLERWAQRPTAPAQDVGKPVYAAPPGPFVLMLGTASPLLPRPGSFARADDLGPPLSADDLPLPTVDETIAALMVLCAPTSAKVTEALVDALDETRSAARVSTTKAADFRDPLVDASERIPPLAALCARLLNQQIDAARIEPLVGAAAEGQWLAAAMLAAAGDEGLSSLRAIDHPCARFYLALAAEEADRERMIAALESGADCRLVAPWFARAERAAPTPLRTALLDGEAPAHALAPAILAQRPATCTERFALLLEGATSGPSSESRTRAWAAIAALGSLDAADRDLVAQAFAACREQDVDLLDETSWAAGCAALVHGALDDDTALDVWKTLLGFSSRRARAPRWAAVAAQLRREAPPEGAWSHGPSLAYVESVVVEPEDIWDTLNADRVHAQIAGCRAVAKAFPDRAALAILDEHDLRRPTWTSALGLGGGAGGAYSGRGRRSPAPETIDELLSQLLSESDRVRAAAALTLGQRLDELDQAGVDRLAACFADAAVVRRDLLRGLARCPSPVRPHPWAERVATLLAKDFDARVRTEAVSALLHLAPGRESTAAVERTLGDRDPRVRCRGAMALRGDEGPPVASVDDADAEVRRLALAGWEYDAVTASETFAQSTTAFGRLMGADQPMWLRLHAARILTKTFRLAPGKDPVPESSDLVTTNLRRLTEDASLPEESRHALRLAHAWLQGDELGYVLEVGFANLLRDASSVARIRYGFRASRN